MQMPLVVTAFSAQGYKEYGQRFLNTYNRYCEFPIVVYTEGMPRLKEEWAIQRDQMAIVELAEFLKRWKNEPAVAGMVATPSWKSRDRASGYSFRTDAWKFCKMVYCIWHGAERAYEGGFQEMCWLDGDTAVRQLVPENFFRKVVPPNAAISYLGRAPSHSETGFLGIRLPEALPILRSWADYYTNGTFLQFNEWHSAFLFDRARELHYNLHCHDLTPGGRGHVIHQCEVGLYFDHLKGPIRKVNGKSDDAKPIK